MKHALYGGVIELNPGLALQPRHKAYNLLERPLQDASCPQRTYNITVTNV